MIRIRDIRLTAIGAVAVASLLVSAATNAQPQADADRTEASEWINPEARKVKKYELGKRDLAIEGYDPVAYFPEGGSKAKKGNKKITHTHRGVLYRFATEANKATFIAAPDKYEPAHGGWCSYAMAKDTYTEPNPKRFVIQNGRLFLFYDGLFGDTYKDWHKEGAEDLEKEADQIWLNESGERPRIPTEDESNDTDEESEGDG
jgi:YHS domain-containing protein